MYVGRNTSCNWPETLAGAALAGSDVMLLRHVCPVTCACCGLYVSISFCAVCVMLTAVSLILFKTRKEGINSAMLKAVSLTLLVASFWSS